MDSNKKTGMQAGLPKHLKPLRPLTDNLIKKMIARRQAEIIKRASKMDS